MPKSFLQFQFLYSLKLIDDFLSKRTKNNSLCFNLPLNNSIFLLDADCGRGFTRVENLCVNISMDTSDVDSIPSKCQAIGAGLLNQTTSGILFLLQVFLLF